MRPETNKPWRKGLRQKPPKHIGPLFALDLILLAAGDREELATGRRKGEAKCGSVCSQG
jgi:hypothetical protein